MNQSSLQTPNGNVTDSVTNQVQTTKTFLLTFFPPFRYRSQLLFFKVEKGTPSVRLHCQTVSTDDRWCYLPQYNPGCTTRDENCLVRKSSWTSISDNYWPSGKRLRYVLDVRVMVPVKHSGNPFFFLPTSILHSKTGIIILRGTIPIHNTGVGLE